MNTSLFHMAISLPKFCVNCLHYIPHKMPKFGKCNLFPIKENYLITGEIKMNQIDYKYCSSARKYDDMCGESGKKYKEFMNNIPE